MRHRTALCTAALLLTVPAVGRTAVAATSAPGVTEVGLFRPTVLNPAYTGDPASYFSDLRLAVDPPSRTLLTLDRLGGVASYDLDTLRARSPHVLDLGGTPQAFLDDPARSRVLVAVAAGGADAAATAVRELSLSGGRAVVVGGVSLGPADLGGLGQRVVGLQLQAGTPYAYLLSATLSQGETVPHTVNVSLVELARSGAGRVIWSTRLPTCVTPLSGNSAGQTDAFGLTSDASALNVGCSTSQPPGFQKVPDPVGVLRLPVVRSGSQAPQPGTPALYPFPGNLGGLGVWDPTVGRLVLEGNSVQLGTTLYAFDTHAGRYLGGVGHGRISEVAVGHDPVRHRMYALSTERGLLVADLQPVPVDGGRVFRTLASHRGHVPLSGRTIVVDPATRRLFVSYGEPDFVVLRDDLPAYRTPPVTDPDAGTSDLPEAPGRTAASVAASAQAYGAVFRQVGGTRNLVFNATGFDTEDAIPVGGGTRELDVAYLDKLTLDDSGVSGASIELDRDQANTQADEGRLPPGTPADWPRKPAVCTDFGGTPKVVTESAATVACDARAESVTSGAAGGTAELVPDGGTTAGVLVSSSGYAASLRRTREGAVATVTATAKGIEVLGGVLRIGEITVVAQARAHGRPGSARGSFVRTLTSVELNGTPLCTTVCDPVAVAATVNAQLAGRVHLDFPVPDPQPAKGSPRGAVTLLRRGVAEQLEEVLLDDQQPNRVEVPGAELTVYQDNYEKERSLVLLAGTAVEAHYATYPIVQPAASTPSPAAPGPAPTAVASPILPVVATAPPRAETAPVVGPPRVSGLLAVVRRVLGLAWSNPAEAVRLLVVWLVLLAPVYLSARRWLLLRRSLALTSGAS